MLRRVDGFSSSLLKRRTERRATESTAGCGVLSVMKWMRLFCVCVCVYMRYYTVFYGNKQVVISEWNLFRQQQSAWLLSLGPGVLEKIRIRELKSQNQSANGRGWLENGIGH